MKMTRFSARTGLCLLALTACLSGCDRGSSQLGKYVSEKNQGDYTELQKDGLCVVKQGTVSLKGKYTLEGKVLTLKIENYNPVKGSLEGNTITDNQGEHWVKK